MEKKKKEKLCAQLPFIVLRPVYTGGLAIREFCMEFKKKNARRLET